MVKNQDPMANLTDDEVRILPPDYTLKKLIGDDVDIKALFSPENVEKAQEVINQHKESFVEWVMADLDLLEQHYKDAAAHSPDCEADIKKLARTSFIIKSQAGTFGYGLGTLIAKSLDEFCGEHAKPSSDHLTVIRKHIDTLSVIFRQSITGNGGKVGNELADNLRKLVDKYKQDKG